ncbi:MAG: hypothetical protein ACP5VP_05720 [Candidatus Limnocylindrales bacterium]
MPQTVSAEARLRARNQLTIPDPVARAAAIEPGTTFVVEVTPDDPDVLRLRRVRTSYAGALRGLWQEGTGVWLDGERAGWEQR